MGKTYRNDKQIWDDEPVESRYTKSKIKQKMKKAKKNRKVKDQDYGISREDIIYNR